MKLETILRHYAICALWSSTQDDGEPLDAVYTLDDIAPETLESMRSDCAEFIEANAQALDESGLRDEQIGHDFWLTRNGHGAGFWDRGLGEIGEALTKASKPYGDVYLYVGDDGYIHD